MAIYIDFCTNLGNSDELSVIGDGDMQGIPFQHFGDRSRVLLPEALIAYCCHQDVRGRFGGPKGIKQNPAVSTGHIFTLH